MADKWKSLNSLWGFLILAGAIMVFLYSGLATATETAAAGAFCAVVLVLVMRRTNIAGIIDGARATIKTTTMMFTIIFCAMIFGYYITITQTTQHLIAWVGTLDVPAWTILAEITVLYLFLGCIMDTAAILFITLPLTYPLMMSLGYDPIWFGVIIVKTIEIGLITPPVGLNAYIVSGTANVPLAEVFRGSGQLLCFEIISLIILLSFPIISTWLPASMSMVK
jgi:tripartite ATP-independent transporter DctM subunit